MMCGGSFDRPVEVTINIQALAVLAAWNLLGPAMAMGQRPVALAAADTGTAALAVPTELHEEDQAAGNDDTTALQLLPLLPAGSDNAADAEKRVEGGQAAHAADGAVDETLLSDAMVSVLLHGVGLCTESRPRYTDGQMHCMSSLRCASTALHGQQGRFAGRSRMPQQKPCCGDVLECVPMQMSTGAPISPSYNADKGTGAAGGAAVGAVAHGVAAGREPFARAAATWRQHHDRCRRAAGGDARGRLRERQCCVQPGAYWPGDAGAGACAAAVVPVWQLRRIQRQRNQRGGRAGGFSFWRAHRRSSGSAP